MFYGIRSERQLMEQLDYNLLYRWFVGLSPDDPVWDPTTFTKNRERLQNGDVFTKFMTRLRNHPQVRPLLSDEHFSVDGTLIEAWASLAPRTAAATTMTARISTARSARTIPRSDPDSRLYRKAAGGRPGFAIWATPSAWAGGGRQHANGKERRPLGHGAQRQRAAKSRCQVSSRRAMIECIFGWGKQHGTMRKTKASAASPPLLNLSISRIPKLVAA